MKDNIKLIVGKIWELKVDAIVSPANNEALINGELAQQIYEYASDEIAIEVNNADKIELGDAVVTGAGKLPCQYIIHAACLDYSGKTNEAAVIKSTRNAMLRAQEKKIKSLAFPPFVTSSNDIIPPRRCAELMISEVIRTTEREAIPDLVYFVLPDRKLYKIYEESLMMI